MTSLIVPVTVILLRGSLAVLILAGAESICGEKLSARVRRALWILCIFLMLVPQPDLSFQPFAIDMTNYQEQVINVADVLPRGLSEIAGDTQLAQLAVEYSRCIPGVTPHSLPYFLALNMAIVPALFLLLASYLKCRRKTRYFQPVTDAKILNIYQRITGREGSGPLLLDSGGHAHPPVLFGFFRQKLLLPVNALKNLSDRELELLLTHELIHYRSGDGIINILTLCLWPFCWYNPFFLAARRRLRVNCELACDAQVLKMYPECTAEYGKLLLTFANTDKPPEVMMAFREYDGELRDRIIYMANLPQRKKSSLLVALMLAATLAAPFGLVSAIVQPEEPMTANVIKKNAVILAVPEVVTCPTAAGSQSPELFPAAGRSLQYPLYPYLWEHLMKSKEKFDYVMLWTRYPAPGNVWSIYWQQSVKSASGNLH